MIISGETTKITLKKTTPGGGAIAFQCCSDGKNIINNRMPHYIQSKLRPILHYREVRSMMPGFDENRSINSDNVTLRHIAQACHKRYQTNLEFGWGIQFSNVSNMPKHDP